MQPPNTQHKEGYALGSVMILLVVATIFGMVGFSIAIQDATKIHEEAGDLRAFWAAEAGVQRVVAMARQQPISSMGFRGMPAAGSTLTWTNEGCVITTTITDIHGGAYTPSSLPSYSIESEGVSGEQTNRVQQCMVLESIARYGLAIKDSAGVYFTDEDLIDGPVYFDDVLQYGGHGTPEIRGRTDVTTNGCVEINGHETLFTPGQVTDAFQGGVYLDQDSFNFGDEYIDGEEGRMKGLAQHNAEGLYLNGDYEVEFHDDGTFTCTPGSYANHEVTVHGEKFNVKKWEPSASNPAVTYTNHSESASTQTKNIIFIDGETYVGGTIEGEATVYSQKKATIRPDGLHYKSAPKHDKRISTWTPEERAAITDLFGLVSSDKIETRAVETVQFHGSLVGQDTGFYPYWRDENLTNGGTKPLLGVYGAVIQNKFQYTEGDDTKGFGTDWYWDRRLDGMKPPHFKPTPYTYYGWRQL